MDNNILERTKQLFALPLLELVSEANYIHRQNHPPSDIQKCALLSIKTGACPEDCAYCPQSAHYKTELKIEPLMEVAKVQAAAKSAKQAGVQRFCMGAAWRQVKDGPEFDRVLEIVKTVKAEGLEVCVTLGMLTQQQAIRLKEAGVYAYNHNLDTSRNFYPQIISTRTYDDRLKTLNHVRQAGMTVCCGGIIGMGESIEDRQELLAELASLNPQPESVPINLLLPFDGTPLARSQPVEPFDLIRMIAVARVLMPKTRVRLACGRATLSPEAHALAFLAGANSIFLGEKLLTGKNAEPEDDQILLETLGIA